MANLKGRIIVVTVSMIAWLNELLARIFVADMAIKNAHRTFLRTASKI